MKKSIYAFLFLFMGANLWAQSNNVKELVGSVGAIVPRPTIETNKKTKQTSAVWHSTNNAWIKDTIWAHNVNVEKDYEKLFPEIANVLTDETPYLPMSWRLTEDRGETVLHCSLQMPADVVTNLWLASEETCLVDSETGVQYRIRRTEPDTFRKHFGVKGKKGDVLDLKIFFPPLLDSTREVTVFGIPNWHLVGDKINVREVQASWQSLDDYDTIPRFHQPRLLREHLSEDKPYDKQNWNTWKVFTDAHLIKPLKDETMALWRTPDATYIAVAYEQNWTREYFGFEPGDILLDESGHQYKLRKVEGVPLGEVFFMEGNAGDYIAYMMVFDPLPPNLKTFTYITPEGEPFSAWGTNWSGKVLHNLNVEKLRANQRLFDYHPRIVVE